MAPPSSPWLGALTLAALGFLGVVLLLAAGVIVLRSWLRLSGAYKARRRALFAPAVELAVTGGTGAQLALAFRPLRPGDAGVVEDLILEAAEQLTGEAFEALKDAAGRLGILSRNRAALNSMNVHRRGEALYALGALRDREAAPRIISMLQSEELNLRFAALRALARIGDRNALPAIVDCAGTMPPPCMTRLASLMLEFGPAARPFLARLVELHPTAIPPRLVSILMAEAERKEET